MRFLLAIVCLVCALLPTLAAADVRVKDITTIRGMRANQLVGYGLVTGLKGTGDSLRSAPFTEQSLNSMLDRMGVNIRGLGARTRNVAAVMVTAELPPFSVGGNRIDVTVTSLGDASSLAGGVLLMTPLQAPDGRVYAVAQGSVTISGFEAKGQNEVVTHGVPTAGRIAGGALVERDDAYVRQFRAPIEMADLVIFRPAQGGDSWYAPWMGDESRPELIGCTIKRTVGGIPVEQSERLYDLSGDLRLTNMPTLLLFRPAASEQSQPLRKLDQSKKRSA